MSALHAAAMTLPAPWSEADFASLLAARGTFVLGDAHAFALGRVVLDEVELLTIATHPDHRRRGLARACLRAFEAKALARGARNAHLEVAAGNTAAVALYEAAGWAHAGRRRGYYRTPDGVPVDALLMSKTLPGA
jgi:[ribosomal protein S18]-alanine N-acetyltransferase